MAKFKFVLWVVLVCVVLAPDTLFAQGLSSPCFRSTPTGSGCTPTSITSPLPVAPGPAPAGSTFITGNATGTTGAVVGTLAGVSAKTTYICGFSVSAIGGTAAVGPITIAGTVTASLVYQLASSASGSQLTQSFSPCIPASATNTAITVTTTADGTASAVAVNSWGFQL